MVSNSLLNEIIEIKSVLQENTHDIKKYRDETRNLRREVELSRLEKEELMKQIHELRQTLRLNYKPDFQQESAHSRLEKKERQMCNEIVMLADEKLSSRLRHFDAVLEEMRINFKEIEDMQSNAREFEQKNEISYNSLVDSLASRKISLLDEETKATVAELKNKQKVISMELEDLRSETCKLDQEVTIRRQECAELLAYRNEDISLLYDSLQTFEKHMKRSIEQIRDQNHFISQQGKQEDQQDTSSEQTSSANLYQRFRTN
ncbi:hypothetical protein GUITHDRAFT_110730 [Guillardia theta CCMP2712]|uniref:Uncharacterized protein n=1 Tax=Guillardia theta (strain CCMP2712) TaxID=905079 RepID=L1J5G9_GUITC|nr:hypothetical protein GUITHDRAFT_110730 [Guillardia theta CCMP2712]EKX43315.1 hypothetical protein GUITHDRAFT_110730 [Guillardia theta CCMP2712]|eukprot:XP_005830295.1 hypothetical protein GUITHDRAFT_110730 [Guillardia theta CCMP2712]